MLKKPPSLKTAMVFAAGLGKRMAPLTDTTPKPLINVGGQPMLGQALEKLAHSDIQKIVVNTHYLWEQIEKYLKSWKCDNPQIELIVSRELPDILETGGGIVNALDYLGNEPFYSVNSDIVWTDNTTPAVERLAANWNPDIMDVLLLLHPVSKAVGYDGNGNFNLLPNGQLTKSGGPEYDYVFTGIQIVNPKLLATMRPEPFSINILYKQAEVKDGSLTRVFGLVHDGEWLHVGTPDGLEKANHHLNALCCID